VSWITDAWSYEMAKQSPEAKIYVQNLLGDFEDTWLNVVKTGQDKNQSQKYKDYQYMKVILTNLTNLSLYLKKKQNPNKVKMTQTMVKKLNNYLIERRKENMPENDNDDFYYQGLLIPFGLSREEDHSILVG
jgi:hypothetical protein